MSASTKRPNAIVRSTYVFRALVTGITLTAFTGISAFAASHVHNAAAPLQPGANGTATSAPTAAPAARSRTTVTDQIPTTAAPPRTRTRRS